MKKRFIAWLLLLGMLATMMPTAFAATETTGGADPLQEEEPAQAEYQFDALYIELTSNNSSTEGDTLAWLNESKEHNASGTLKLVEAGQNAEAVQGLKLKKIKGRGNSSWTSADKKGYNITLDKKSELIDGAGAAKKWCLLGLGNTEWGDHTFLSTIAAFDLFQQLGGSAAISYRMVDLYVNGEYVGLYMLTEKVEINSARVNINGADMTEDETSSRTVNSTTADITEEEQKLLDLGIQEFKYSPNTTVASDGGYILESGCWYDTEACGFITSHNCCYVLKEPEYVSLEQIYKIASYVQEFEDALFSETGYNEAGKYYSDYIDLDSAARMFLVDCFIGNSDFFFSSQFMYIDGDDAGLTGKFLSGPGWDYDGYWLNDSLYMRDMTDRGAFNLVPQLLAKGDFVSTLTKINQEEFADLIAAMDGDSDTQGTLRWYANYLTAAQAKNDGIWNFDYPQFSAEYLTAFDSRVTTWNTIWSDTTNALRGVTIVDDNGTLTATAYGGKAYQWYRVDDSDGTKGIAIQGATEATYVPTENGTYYVLVTGTALAGTAATEMISNSISVEIPLTTQQEAAKAELLTYKSAADYRTAQQAQLVDAIAEGAVNINAAETPAAVAAALEAAKAVMDQIKTDAQRTAEEQGNSSTDLEESTEAITFTDVPEGEFYTEAVAWAVVQKITNGATATTFNPNGSCTREQVVTFLWRAAGSPEPTTAENLFTDVNEADFSYKAVLWAVEKGITKGATDTTFNPKGVCTRGQVVTFLWRYAGEPEVSTADSPFTDVKAGEYYDQAVAWAVGEGITNGMSATTFAPNGTCTRGHVVTFLYRDLA